MTPSLLPTPSPEGLRRVHYQSHGAVIGELNVHHLAEYAGLNGRPLFLDLGDDILVELVRFFGSGRVPV